MEDDIRNGTRFHTFNAKILDCWQCGDFIYETSSFAYSLSTPHTKQPFAGNGKSFSIWQEMDDGTILVKYSTYNLDQPPF